MSKPLTTTVRARWGLMITTLVMGIALLVTGLVGFSDARVSAESVARARANDVFRATRQALRRMGPIDATALEMLRDELGEGELSYLAVVGRDARIRVQAGTPITPLDAEGIALLRAPSLTTIDGKVRLVAPLGRKRAGQRRVLVVDFEATLSQRIASRGLTHLVISIAAVLVLLISALVFWRLGRRADRIEVQLARDKRLAALGEMSTVLGHELRNPLASLKGHAQLVVERLASDHRAADSAARVVQEAQRLERLTGQVLDFARTGAVDLVEDADPGAVLRDAAASVGDARIAVDVGGAPSHWPLDPPRIHQVLTNILDNAQQASSGDDDLIDAAVSVVDGELVYTVRDRGEGFSDAVAQPFEPFQTGRVKGTGLGLAVAKRIVDAHRGTISASNHPDGGAVVRVTIPGRP